MKVVVIGFVTLGAICMFFCLVACFIDWRKAGRLADEPKKNPCPFDNVDNWGVN